MATFTYIASFEATEASKPRVTTFQAGDGYQQRVGFGLHRDGKEWQLQFLNRTDTERDNILTFLEARAAVESFDWTPPRGSAVAIDHRRYGFCSPGRAAEPLDA